MASVSAAVIEESYAKLDEMVAFSETSFQELASVRVKYAKKGTISQNVDCFIANVASLGVRSLSSFESSKTLWRSGAEWLLDEICNRNCKQGGPVLHSCLLGRKQEKCYLFRAVRQC